MAIEYAPLFALETQFQSKDGRNNTGGWLKVFLAATDDPATTYSDYNGTRNPEKIVLDDDGRALVICDKSKAYRLEVYSMDGSQPVSAMGEYATTAYVDGSMSGKLDTTAFNSGDFYTTANESGFVNSAYVDSAVSGKLDTSAFASASAGFQPTGVTHGEFNPYFPFGNKDEMNGNPKAI